MKGLAIITFLLIGLTSCTKECRTCQDTTGSEVEYCKEESIFYTDTDGNEVSFDELIIHLEGIGWTCE